MDNTATITVKEYDELREMKKKYKRNQVMYMHKAFYSDDIHQTEFMIENEAVNKTIWLKDEDILALKNKLDDIKRPWKWRMFIGFCMGVLVMWGVSNG